MKPPWEAMSLKKLDNARIKKILLAHGLEERRIDQAFSAKKYKMTLPKHDWHDIHYKFESIVDADFCIHMYENECVPIFRLAMAYGVSDVALRACMIRHGVKLKGHACGSNSQNDYFENINTRDKAYFLGLLAADGSVVWRKNSNHITLELIAEDDYIIKRFVEYAKLDVWSTYDNRDESSRYRIDFSSDKMCQDLAKYGIVQKKSHKDSIFIPEIDTRLIPHFIRGYFDGDGIAKTSGYLGFCGSKTIIKQIHDYFVELYDVSNTKITFNRWNGIYYIQWGKKADTMKIADVLYHDCVDLYLRRKQEKIFSRLRPEVWKHTDLNLSKPTNVGCLQFEAAG